MPAPVRTFSPEFAGERFQLNFFISGKSWEGLFDSLEVWRSRSSDLGPYEPMHDDTWMPATLPFGQEDTQAPLVSDEGKSVPIVGLTSEFSLGEHQAVTVAFTGSGTYLTYAEAAAQIVAQSGGLLMSFVAGGILVVRTVEAGIKALLCLLFIVLTAPVSAHALARSAYRSGIKPSVGTIIDEYTEDIPKIR